MSFRIPLNRVNWTTSAFLIGTALVALIATPWYLWQYGIDFFQVSLFVFYVYATGMSITLGYHRLFSHRAFKAKLPVRLWTLIFGACAFENSALDWVSDHRRHHKHVDQDEDPYDISKGFFWAHIGWLLFKLHPQPPMDNVADLKKDRLVMWQHRWVHLIAVGFGLVLPAALGYLWNGVEGALGGFLLAGVLRIVVVQHSTFFINSLCHSVGKRPYSSKCSARDSAVMALLTFGEGYHNFHHTFQHDYRNGIRKRSFDPTKWAIWLLAKTGLVSNLRRVSQEKIVLAEMAEARRCAEVHLESAVLAKLTATHKHVAEFLHELHERLAASYRELEDGIAKQARSSRETLASYRRQTRELLDHLAYIAKLKASGSLTS